MMFIDEVIGAGEVALADARATEPDLPLLARIVLDTHVGGSLSNKAGVTHFHIGPGKRRMQCLFDLLESDRYEIEPAWLYPTHVERSPALMRDAIRLVKAGAHVDIDVQEGDLAKWLGFYHEHGGDLSRLTVSSDASTKGPDSLFAQLRNCARGHRLPLAKLLALSTANPATVLGLHRKGRLEVGCDGDILVLDKDEFSLVHVLAGSTVMVRDGTVVVREKFLRDSDRRITLRGDDAGPVDGTASDG